jgi:predicted NBD/HSP70 family sugar kinase
MLYVRTKDRLAIAIDVRLSSTYLMLSDFSGREIALESFVTIVDPTALVDELATRIRRMIKHHRKAGTCQGVGLVVPGMVDHATGRVLNAPQVGWRDVDIRDALAERVGFPVYIEGAPIACALGQMWLGEPGTEAPRDFAYVIVGDGVGAGVVVNGEVLRGAGYTAGEFGHVPLDIEGVPCMCGAKGCVEAYTSNLATLVRYSGRAFNPREARAVMQTSGLTIGDVLARARGGDRQAGDAIDTTARYLGLGLAGIINTLNPAQIFVGGEITAAWDRVEPILRAAVKERALTAPAANTPIVPGRTGRYPRLRGATALVVAPQFAIPHIA